MNTSRRKTAHLRNWNVSDLPMDHKNRRHEFRHFHQLFHHLLHRETPAPAMTARRRDLGHFDNLLRNEQVEMPERLQHPLFAHLRHRSIKNLDHGHHVGNVLHGAQLDPLQRPTRLGQTGRPQPPLGIFLVEQPEECRGRRGLLSPWRLVLVPVPLPGPCLLLTS